MSKQTPAVVVLVHGLLGVGLVPGRRLGGYFLGIDRTLKQAGFTVLMPRLHPTASIEQRTQELGRYLQRHRRALRQGPVLLVGHSMGGLDCRRLLSRGLSPVPVAGLLTVATPHRGSAFATLVHDSAKRVQVLHLARRLGLSLASLHDLTPEHLARFNDETPDMPGVRYTSVGCWREHAAGVCPVLWPSWRYLNQRAGPNDGWVPRASAAWGEHLADWPCDHFHSVNKRFNLDRPEPVGNVSDRWLAAVKATLHPA